MKTINWNFKEKICIICGEGYKPSNGKQLTCGDKCSYERKFGYNTLYNKTYKKEYYLNHAEEIKTRAKSYYLIKKYKLNQIICLDCDKEKKLEIHHTSYKPNKYILICKNCHYKRHSKVSKK